MKMKMLKKSVLPLLLLLICIGVLFGCSTAADAVAPASDTGNNTVTADSINLTTTSSDTVVSAEDFDLTFTNRDQTATYDTASATKITLSGGSATVSGTGASASGGVVTISSAGTYILSGTLDNGQIRIEAGEEDKIQLVLNGVTIHCADNPAIFIKQADKVFITLAEGTVNKLSDGSEYTLTEEDSNLDGVIFSRADLTLNGSGTLNITANYSHGIVSKDDLVITGGTYQVSAPNGHGLNGKDCIKIAAGTFIIEAGKDGLQSDQTDDAARGYIYIAGGTFEITAGNDAIQAETRLQIAAGTFNLLTGGGSDTVSLNSTQNGMAGGFGGGEANSGQQPTQSNMQNDGAGQRTNGAMGQNGRQEMPTDGMAGMGGGNRGQMNQGQPPATADANTALDSTTQPPAASGGAGMMMESSEVEEDTGESMKGLKGIGELIITGGTFTIDSADDALHSNGDISVTAGQFTLRSGDDAIHADNAVTIADGQISIEKSYEGIEGATVTILAGTIDIVASDDGINASSDAYSRNNMGFFGGGNAGTATTASAATDTTAAATECYIRIAGGSITITAGADGLDSNNDFYLEGGTVYITAGGNPENALDYDGQAAVSGGTIMGTGGNNMAQNFGASSSQYSILYYFDTSIAAGQTVTIKDASGNLIDSFTPASSYQTVVISNPQLQNGATYTITAGDQSVQITLTGVATSNGSSSMNGGGGGRGGAGGMGGQGAI